MAMLCKSCWNFNGVEPCRIEAEDNGFCRLHNKLGNLHDISGNDVTEYVTGRVPNNTPNPIDMPSAGTLSSRMIRKYRNLYDFMTSSRTTNAPNNQKLVDCNDVVDASSEDKLAIKKLILKNSVTDDMCQELGPAYHDESLLSDEEDPITFDRIFHRENGEIIYDTPKYMIFSYKDDNSKIRLLTLPTIKYLLDNSEHTYPGTDDPIRREDLDRAKRVIQLYSDCVDIFEGNTCHNGINENVVSLFKKFENFSVYFEPEWVCNLSADALKNIMKMTVEQVSRQGQLINPFINANAVAKSFVNKITHTTVDDIVELWDILYELRHPKLNQMPIWIIASILKDYVPEVRQKYPNISL